MTFRSENLLFRQATQTDAPHIAALVNRAYRPAEHAQGWTHEAHLVGGARVDLIRVQALLVAPSVVLLACQATNLVACVHVQAHGHVTTIGMLATEPTHQAQGVGKQLLRHAEQYAEQHLNALEFNMWVLSCRLELIAFYLRQGYERTPQHQAYPVSSGVGAPLVPDLELVLLSKKADAAWS
jgi:GNAT superfamily N-acetyltransferase